jgi:hypothetical protein
MNPFPYKTCKVTGKQYIYTESLHLSGHIVTTALLRDTIKATRYTPFYLLLTAIGLTRGGSSAVHIYIQAVHRIQRTEYTQQ